MRNALVISGLALGLGCTVKEESSPSTSKCDAGFSLDFTLADGGTEVVELSTCGGLDINPGFEFGDESHLRYLGLAMQADSGGNCYIGLIIDPYCGDDVYTFGGPEGYGAKGTLVLTDCEGLPEGANTTWSLEDGEVDMVFGFKDPGSGPGKMIRTAPVGTVDGTATEGDLTVHVTGEFIIDKRAPTGEVSETICD
jgi:hypothetical protein